MILFHRYKREQLAHDNEARAVARGLARLVVPVQGRLRAAADPAPRAQPRGEEAQNVMHVSVFTELTTTKSYRSPRISRSSKGSRRELLSK